MNMNKQLFSIFRSPKEEKKTTTTHEKNIWYADAMRVNLNFSFEIAVRVINVNAFISNFTAAEWYGADCIAST